MREGGVWKDVQSKSNALFQLLLSSVTDPLEFKEVKLVVVEILAKFPPERVLPFIFGYIVAFLEEESDTNISPESLTSIVATRISTEILVPSSCGVVTAKLMIYYLNRMFAEDSEAYKNEEIVSRVFALLIRILSIPSTAGDQSRLADLQMGSIDCSALVLARIISESSTSSERIPLLQLVLHWIGDSSVIATYESHKDVRMLQDQIAPLLDQTTAANEGGTHYFPLQVRICICNVLLR